MDESGIWFLVIAATVVILVITFITSVTVLHKKFVEKPVEKYEKDKEGNT
jgi:hypothetical protein